MVHWQWKCSTLMADVFLLLHPPRLSIWLILQNISWWEGGLGGFFLMVEMPGGRAPALPWFIQAAVNHVQTNTRHLKVGMLLHVGLSASDTIVKFRCRSLFCVGWKWSFCVNSFYSHIFLVGYPFSGQERDILSDTIYVKRRYIGFVWLLLIQ